MTTSTNATKQRRTHRSEAAWRELFTQFERSGQTRERFCAEQGLALRSFSQWRQKLRQASHSPAAVAEDALFVELAAEAEPCWDVELELGAGVVLRIRRQPC
jgi:hypothetical protein